MLYETKLLNSGKKEDLIAAVSLLRAGEVVAVPSETVYGLAADARNVRAVEKIFLAKNRPLYHPLIVHIASFEKLGEWARDISPLAIVLAKKFWPGPLTLLLNKSESVNDVVTGGLSTIAIRVPSHPVFLSLLNELDMGLAAPSANLHKRISPTTAAHVMVGLSGRISAVLDAGPCEIGFESTILDLTGTPRILRPGPITQQMLEDELQAPIQGEHAHAERVPGNMAAHYQPYTSTELMTLKEIEHYLLSLQNTETRVGVLHYSLFENDSECVVSKKMSPHKSDYARLMYQALHELDALGVSKILVETPPCGAEWSGIFDRLSRACHQLAKISVQKEC